MKVKNEVRKPIILRTSTQVSPGRELDEIKKTLQSWQKENKMQQLWNGDTKLWTNSDENKWLGWLDVKKEENEIARIEALAKEIKAKTTDIVLLGMGGSSLCAAMMADIFGKIPGFPTLHILDSTDPLQIAHLEQRIDLKNTLFIVSSKSGTTLEPKIFTDYFYQRLQQVLNKTEVSDRFVAITDPGTALEKEAKQKNFKAIFYGVPSIGGRYSALSNFGMVPSGLMGVNIREFLQNAEIMQQACDPKVASDNNPGLVLGVILGECAKQGINKITFITSPAITALGAWLEQLLAESTGKEGKGLIPIDLEPVGTPAVYGNDRLFVYIRLDTHADAEQDRMVAKLVEADFVVTTINFTDKMHLGAELFRWEIATAVAGSIININPFNQPDVEESKTLALQLTAQYDKTHELAKRVPIFSADGIQLYADEKNERELAEYLPGKKGSIENYLRAQLARIKKDDYVDFSAFIEMSVENLRLLQDSRVLIRNHKKVATCLGFGPRFLHSTGQLYKGGPDTGVFFQITADHPDDIKIPGHESTFGVVITAQAQADFTVLTKRSRRVLGIHLGKDVSGGLKKLSQFFKHILTSDN